MTCPPFELLSTHLAASITVPSKESPFTGPIGIEGIEVVEVELGSTVDVVVDIGLVVVVSSGIVVDGVDGTVVIFGLVLVERDEMAVIVDLDDC